MFSAQVAEVQGPTPSAPPSPNFEHTDAVNWWCEEALRRLKTSDRTDTESIIKFVPVHPRAILRVLETRWDRDRELDSLLQTLRTNTAASPEGNCSAQNSSPAKTLIELLLPPGDPSHCGWDWTWTPGNPYDTGTTPAVVAQDTYSYLDGFCRHITLGKLIRYTVCGEEGEIHDLFHGADATSKILRQRYGVLKHEKKLYREVEEHLRDRGGLAHWIFASSLDLTDTLPQDIFRSITRPVQDMFSQKIFRLHELAAIDQQLLFLSQNQSKWQSLPLEYFSMQIRASRMSPTRLANDLADHAFYFHSQFTRSDLLESNKVVKRIVGRYSNELANLVRDCVVARPDLSDMLFDTAQCSWDIRDFCTAPAILLGLSAANSHPRRQAKLWDIIKSDTHYRPFKIALAVPKPAIPYFPVIDYKCGPELVMAFLVFESYKAWRDRSQLGRTLLSGIDYLKNALQRLAGDLNLAKMNLPVMLSSLCLSSASTESLYSDVDTCLSDIQGTKKDLGSSPVESHPS